MSWDFGHFFTSLFGWTSFNHAQCNAILQARNITIDNAYLPFKEGWERQETLPALAFLVCWFALMGFIIRPAWLPENRHKQVGQVRWITLIFLLVGLICFWLTLVGAVQYVDTCRSLLNVK
jgi:hypothetical protein